MVGGTGGLGEPEEETDRGWEEVVNEKQRGSRRQRKPLLNLPIKPKGLSPVLSGSSVSKSDLCSTQHQYPPYLPFSFRHSNTPPFPNRHRHPFRLPTLISYTTNLEKLLLTILQHPSANDYMSPERQIEHRRWLNHATSNRQYFQRIKRNLQKITGGKRLKWLSEKGEMV